MKKSLLALALVGALTSFSANAAVEGTFSLGASLGWGHAYNTNTSVSDEEFQSGGWIYQYVDFDAGEKNSFGIKLTGEYNFTEWFGLGIGYNYFTGTDIKYEEGFGSQDYDTHVFDFYARFAYPFDKDGSDIFVKVGPTANVIKTDGGSDSSFGAVLGLGGQWAVNNKISIRAGYDYYFKTADSDEDLVKYESDTGLLYVGVNYNL